MTSVYKLFDDGGGAVHFIRSKIEIWVISPTAGAFEIREGHDLYGIHSKSSQIAERVDQGLPVGCGRKIPEQKLIDHQSFFIGPLEISCLPGVGRFCSLDDTGQSRGGRGLEGNLSGPDR